VRPVEWYLPRGRMGRRRWWTAYVLPIVGLGLLAWAADLATGVATLDSGEANPLLRLWLAFGWISTAYWAVVLVPMVAAWVVRLHDRGMSAWWLLLNLLPVVGSLCLVAVAGALPGERRPNIYGPPTASGARQP
jgi:uncharacterized membrane protein YhaH (DUF805 family)